MITLKSSMKSNYTDNRRLLVFKHVIKSCKGLDAVWTGILENNTSIFSASGLVTWLSLFTLIECDFGWLTKIGLSAGIPFWMVVVFNNV